MPDLKNFRRDLSQDFVMNRPSCNKVYQQSAATSLHYWSGWAHVLTGSARYIEAPPPRADYASQSCRYDGNSVGVSALPHIPATGPVPGVCQKLLLEGGVAVSKML